jgi:hypothetical protein
MFSRFSSKLLAIASTIVIATIHSPILAQNPEFITQFGEYTPSLFTASSGETIASGWIWLDGRPAFRVATRNRNTLDERISSVQKNANLILRDYLRQESTELKVEVRNSQGLNVIYVNGAYLMSITSIDAEIRGTDSQTLTDILVAEINRDLLQARAERDPSAWSGQAREAAIALAITVFISAGLTLWQRKLKNSIADPSEDQPANQNLDPDPIANDDFSDLMNTSLWGDIVANPEIAPTQAEPNARSQPAKPTAPISTALRLRNRNNLRTLKSR